MTCWKCGAAVTTTGRVGVREHCPKCDRALHCCRNCGFYDSAYHNQCREPVAERVVDKEKFNFCDYFTPASAASRQGPQPAADPRARLDQLFRKKS